MRHRHRRQPDPPAVARSPDVRAPDRVGRDPETAPIPPDAALARAATGRDDEGRTDRVADRCLMRMLRRRTWAVHRHVHLVAAFLAANERRPITTVLAAGCGTGLSELFLAASFPEVRFTLTDLDPVNLEGPTLMVDELGFTNVTVEPLDLLAPRRRDRADFVTSIEALEHIEDDQRAAANLIDHCGGHLHLLVPYCSETERTDPRLRSIEWERHEHVRVGYTHDTFAELVRGLDPVYVRNAYLMPEAAALRRELTAPTEDEVIARRVELVTEALVDLRDVTVAGGRAEAQAIEALVDVARSR